MDRWSLAAALAILIPSLILFIFIKKSKTSARSDNLPPGPKKLPIIGNLHLVSSLPFRRFRDLAIHYGPIMHLKLGQVSAIVVSSPEIAKEILKEKEHNFISRPSGIAIKIMTYNHIDIAFCPYGDYWRQMRKLCIIELLSMKSVRSFGRIRNDEVSHLIGSIRFASGKPVNLTEKVFTLMSSIICRAAYGRACKDSDALKGLLKEVLVMSQGFGVEDLFPSVSKVVSWSKVRLLRMRRKLDVILDDIIDEHRANLVRISDSGQDEDLVDVLLRIKETEELQFPIRNDNIKAILFDMFAAGTETSASVIDWTMVELMRSPRVMAKAQAEARQVIQEDNHAHKFKYLKLVIKEALRLHPPGPLLPRHCKDQIQINGYTLPANAKVLLNIWAMQRDPNYWPDPERFEPERFETQSVDFTGGDFEFLPFGSGKRMCPGMAFGLAGVELTLARLLYSFDWKLPDGVEPEELDMTEKLGLSAPRRQDLLVVATNYEPST